MPTSSSHVQRRLAVIESLCRYSHILVTLKKGDSATLARAEINLAQAIKALGEVRQELGGRKPDAQALAIAAMGKVAADYYTRAAGCR